MKKLIENQNLQAGMCPRCGMSLLPVRASDEVAYCSDVNCPFQIDVEELRDIQGEGDEII